MSRPRLPFAGILVTGIVFTLLFLGYCASGESPRSDPAPARGGRLVSSIRVEPGTFNRLVSGNAVTELLSLLTQGRLVRLNRVTWELEPWLAESWSSSADGRTHTFKLRPGVAWSDGAPLTSADVLFTVRTVFDERVGSVLASGLMIADKPIEATAPDEHTVVFTYAGPSGLGVSLFDNLPIFPRHKLEGLSPEALKAAWSMTTPLNEIVGTGPFVPSQYVPGQRLVLARNPHYWRKDADGAQLPYLDQLVLQIVPNPNVELARLEAGDIDMIQDEIATDDYVAARRAEAAGAIKLIERGISTDADALWFCQKPEKWKGDRRFAFVSKPEFRQAISHAVDRERFADTVFLGEAMPTWGPVTRGNETWFTPNLPRYAHSVDTAKALLKSIGLEDRTGDGIVEDASGAEARFIVMTQQGLSWNERALTVIQEDLQKIGVKIDVNALEQKAMIARLPSCDYEAVYMRLLASLDPAANMDFWLSSGPMHAWNIGQPSPATEWEARMDALMREQATTLDQERRQQIFLEVQKTFAENLPMLHFAAPRLWTAHSTRVVGAQPSVLRPPLLWAADSLGVAAQDGD